MSREKPVFNNVSYLSASQYRYSNDNGLDGAYTLNGPFSITEDLSQPGGRFEYGPGGGRYERDAAVGATPQIQSPDRQHAKKESLKPIEATSQVISPLHTLDDVDSSLSLPEETTTNTYIAVKNEIPLNHPRQDESRLLQHLLTNYDRRVRPIVDPQKNITIYVGITLTQIFDMVSMYVNKSLQHTRMT